MIRFTFIVLFLFLSSGIFAQKQDTVKHKIIKQWSLSRDFSEEVALPFDTVFSFFHRFRTADRFSPVNATLGNYGLPFYQFSFFDRVTDPDRFLTSNYYPFLFLPERAVFMNTQKPFSELVWSFAGPRETSEQTFRIRHSQNVNRFLNFGLIYDIIYSLGQYNYQRAENKDFTFFSSYTGDRYKLYFSAGVNNLVSYENGGITDVKELEKENTKTREVPVNLGALNKATSFLKNRNLLLVQRYTIGSKPVNKADTIPQEKTGFLGLSGTFSHIFTLESNKRTYTDNSPGSGFYDTIYINKSVTFDSLYSRSVMNTLRFDFTTSEARKFRLGGGVGIRNEMFKYSQIVPMKDSLLKGDTVVWNRSNNVLVGRLYNNIGDNFRWLATGELFLTGYRSGDVILNGEISKSFDWKKGRAVWLITGGLSTRQPSFWYENWGSNHFKWSNNLDKEIRADIGTRFSYPARKAELKFNYAIIDNYTDFGPDATPSQHSGGISIAAVTLSKDLRLWKFHLATDLILQKSSNPEIIDLPLATTRSAAYFEHLFRFESTNGRLNLQVGADATYNTMYHPYAYMPAIGRFYRQDQISTGNYPFVNLFLNFKVKRTRVFVMLDHLNAKLMGYKYDMIPSYPMNVRMFRYGLAWTFYD
ncbi:MAG: putative porin [Bacteroidales bacterium]|nr:putative porin [Bacteroidales bacterium]